MAFCNNSRFKHDTPLLVLLLPLFGLLDAVLEVLDLVLALPPVLVFHHAELDLVVLFAASDLFHHLVNRILVVVLILLDLPAGLPVLQVLLFGKEPTLPRNRHSWRLAGT